MPENTQLLPPIVVDLDGTLTPTDTLVESTITLAKKNPFALFNLPFKLLKGRAELKSYVASKAKLSVENFPWNEELLSYLKKEKSKGRKIILATAAHHSIADKVAQHLDIFDDVISTTETHNLKGKNKLAAIQQLLGDNFIYAGDHRADIPIWKSASGAILVSVDTKVAKSLRREILIEHEFPKESISLKTWLRAIRMHQWLKNLLIFVPLLTAFSFLNLDKLTSTILAFIAFSLTASSTYIVNDLWDLEADRAHPRKKNRPFASAQIPILKGLGLAGILLVISFLIAAFVSWHFFLMLFFYLILTSVYSWVLKRYVLIDVLMLSFLFTLRVLAGSVAANIETSSWLLAFSIFIFLSLALIKRCSELITLRLAGTQNTKGRDYQVSDLDVLIPLGVTAGMSAVVVFGLFINTPQTQANYDSPELLWCAGLGLIYWLARLWIKTSRGEMHDDPLVFALKDFGSQITIASIIATTLLAHFIQLG